MGEALDRYVKATRADRRAPRKDALPAGERAALLRMRAEAKRAGSELTSGGKGGLPPSLVLGVMRRDGWHCKACGELGDMNVNGGLGVHHKSEHLESPKAKARSLLLGKQGRIDTAANVVTLCANCHDRVHEDDREDAGQPRERDADGD